jgi:thiopeptide-type bacteriocin biosynthesis protein
VVYRFVDAAVVRAATRPPDAEVPSWPDLTGTTNEHVAQWRSWLRQVWASNEFADVVEVASPALARRVRQVCDGGQLPERAVRRAVMSVIRYQQRLASRATPFGLFAGVATVRLGSPPAARFGVEHHVVARVNSEWLGEVITHLEACRELRHRLLVVGNNLAFVRDDQLVVGCQQQPSGKEPAEVAIAYTKAVHLALQAAQTPVRLAGVADALATEFPDRSESVIDRMLARLVAQGFLITSLRPPMTATDPLSHVLAALNAAEADAIPEVAGLLGELRGVNTDLAQHNKATRPQQRDLRTTASRKMATIAPSERPVAVDLRLAGGVVLPHAVAREAEAAAAALVRLTPHPFGSPAWQDYHRRFVERHGIGALVTVDDLLNADSGLGFPAGYRDSRINPLARPGLSERDVTLLAWAQIAAMQQNTEIVLDDTMIADLPGVDAATPTRVQPHTDLRCRVHATSLDALDRGEFELAVTGVSRAAGTTTGRFLDLFNTDDRERLINTYAELPTVTEGALQAQVSCPGVYQRTENVTRTLAVLPHLLPIAEHCPHDDSKDGTVSLADLAVSADAEWLYLISLSRRQAVEPRVFSAVEFINHAHPILRFLCEISTAHVAACAPFSWGAAGRLPFLPRVRYRRSILSPAMWTLASRDLPSAAAPWQVWADSLSAWRHQFRVPARVYLGDTDRRIQLDLDEPAYLNVLRAELDHFGKTTVREAPDATALGWIDGRAHDFAIPLAATARPAAPARTWSTRTIGREHGHLPGSGDWMFVKLYGHPDRQTAILTGHLSTLLSTWDTPPEWWFLRYHDPERHLRLRFRLRGGADFGSAAARVTEWTAELRRLGLISHVQWDTYYPETGRFGDGKAMAAAEAVFATDSAAAIAQLQASTRGDGPHQRAIIAASMVDLAISVTGDTDAGMRWLIDHLRTPSTPAVARPMYKQAIRLTNPNDGWSALRAIPGGEDIADFWTRRRATLATYRAALETAGEITPDSVLSDLLHLHHVRLAGVHPNNERACRRLARAAALSWITRTRGAS